MSMASMPSFASIARAHRGRPRLGAEDADVERASRGSMPWRSISSAIASMYDGVTMMTSRLKSWISCTCRSVCPPDIGITVQPSFSAP